MGHATNNGLTRGLAVLAALVGGLAALLVLSSSGAFAQGAKPDGPETVYALTTADKLLRFDGDNPRQASSKNIKGLRNGESLVGIDFRPSSQTAGKQNTLYGVGNKSYIYTINPSTAVATRGPQITADGRPVALRGTSFGIDFNPTVDRLRIVGLSNQNLRVNVDTGALADFDENPANGTQPDQDLAYVAGDQNAGADPNVTAVAYRNSQPAAFGTMNTELYDIDAGTDDLSEQTPANNGTLVTEGPLRINTNAVLGFDIVTRGTSPAGDMGFAALQPVGTGSSSFYKVNLDNGRALRIDRIGARGTDVEGLAIPVGQR